MALFVVTISMYILSVVAVHWLIFLKLKNQTAFCQVQSLSKNTYTYTNGFRQANEKIICKNVIFNNIFFFFYLIILYSF